MSNGLPLTRGAGRVARMAEGSALWNDALARFAIGGPIFFGLMTQLLIILQADFLSQNHDLRREFPISPNALGPLGALMVLNFMILGASVVALARLLWTTSSGRVTRAGVILLGFAGVALVAEASPMEYPPAMAWHGKLHFIAFFVWALALLLAYVVLGFGLRKEARWRKYGTFTLVTVVVSLALVFISPPTSTDFVTRHGAWWGPLGRAHFIVWIAWFSTMAWKARALLAEPRSDMSPLAQR